LSALGQLEDQAGLAVLEQQHRRKAERVEALQRAGHDLRGIADALGGTGKQIRRQAPLGQRQSGDQRFARHRPVVVAGKGDQAAQQRVGFRRRGYGRRGLGKCRRLVHVRFIDQKLFRHDGTIATKAARVTCAATP
jgi:hypothetical protein